MSAVSAPYGFRPVKHRFGGVVRTFSLRGGIASSYGTAIFVGDPVKAVTGGTYEKAAAGDSMSAVFAGWHPEDSGVYNVGRYWPASTTYSKAGVFLFWPIEDVIFKAQGVGSIAQTALGDVCDHVVGSGNTRSGMSTSYLASGSLAGAGNSAQWKIFDLHDETGNAWGDSYTQVHVLANEINLGRVPGNAI